MTNIPENVDESIELLKKIASQEGIEIESDSVDEIRDYLAMERVRDLSEQQKAVVALRIGEETIGELTRKPGKNIVDRDDVKRLIWRLCPRQFERCHGAAFMILSSYDDPGDLSPLTR